MPTILEIKSAVDNNIIAKTAPSSISKHDVGNILKDLADAIETNGVFAKVVNNATFSLSGNVLIGSVTDNGNKLQLTGNAHVTGDIIVKNGKITLNDGTYTHNIKQSANNLIFESASTLQFKSVTGGGVLSFGVLDSFNKQYLFNQSDFKTDATGFAFYAGHLGAFGFGTYAATGFYKAIQNIYTDTNNNGISFHTLSGASTIERARINSAGNFIIGSTTDNGNKFQVTGSGYFSGDVNIGSSKIISSPSSLDFACVNNTFRFITQDGANRVIEFKAGTYEFWNSTFAAAVKIKSDLSRLEGIQALAYIDLYEPSTGKLHINNTQLQPIVFSTNNIERARFTDVGNLLIGTNTDIASSLFTLNSVSKGFLPPRMTTAQINAIATPSEGLHAYDTTTHKPKYYNGSSWVESGSDVTFLKEGGFTTNFTKAYGGGGFYIRQLIVRATVAALPNLKIGYTSGGGEIYDGTLDGGVLLDDANHTKDLQLIIEKNITAATTIYFSGISGSGSTLFLWTEQRSNIPT